MQPFTGRTIAITGAAAGLGEAYADYLAGLGADLVLSDIGEGIDAVAARLGGGRSRAIAVRGDISDPATSTAIIDAAMTATGRIDGIVNNAGNGIKKPFADLALDDFRRLMDVHFWGTLQLCKAAWPIMEQAGYGRIVNTISRSIFGLSGWSAYTATKGAIFGLTRTMAVEGEPLGIRVNLISPSAGTDIGRNAGALATATQMSEKKSSLPASKVAPTVAWLVHPDCTVSGKTFTSASGHVAQLQLGSTEGVATGGEDLAELAAAIADPRMTSGFVEETSVADSARTALAFRAWS